MYNYVFRFFLAESIFYGIIFSMEKLMEIRRVVDRSTAQKGSESSIYRRHALRAIEDQRWASAEIFLDRMLEADARDSETWLLKGWLRHHCRHDEATALECYREVIRLNEGNPDDPHVVRAKRGLERLLDMAG